MQKNEYWNLDGVFTTCLGAIHIKWITPDEVYCMNQSGSNHIMPRKKKKKKGLVMWHPYKQYAHYREHPYKRYTQTVSTNSRKIFIKIKSLETVSPLPWTLKFKKTFPYYLTLNTVKYFYKMTTTILMETQCISS